MPSTLKRAVTLLVILVAGFWLFPGDAAGAAERATAPITTLYDGGVVEPDRPVQPAPEEQALLLAAQQYQLPFEALSIVNSAQGSFPGQDNPIWRFKVMDERDNRLYVVTLNDAGLPVDEAALEAGEQSIQAQASERLAPELASQLLTAPADEPIPVILWLKETGYVLPPRVDPDASLPEGAMDSQLRAVDTARASAVAAVNAPVLDRIAQKGLQVSADAYAPVVYTALTPAQIREAAGWPEVDQVYLDGVNAPELDSVISTVGADVVFSRRIIGRGVKVGLVEVGGQADANNPYLEYFYPDTAYTCTNTTYKAHTTGLLGVLFSSHPVYTGMATGVWPWVGGSCDGSDSRLQERSTAAVDWGARVINLSWGSSSNLSLIPGAEDRFFDNLWFTRYRVIVKSAGNRSCGSDGNITHPGLAYNLITVGNFDDKNNANWADDSMQGCSSWKDPVSDWNDREKPEVAAPGTDITSTVVGEPWIGNVGTGSSYSSAVVSGIAADIMQRKTTLEQWPEIVKAILMASAVNNIEGAERLSESDGAGGVSARHADDIARSFGGGSGGKDKYTCASIPAVENVTTFALGAGRMARIVIVWDQNPNYSLYEDRPGADLDLVILGPNGREVANSASNDNTYEIVQFTPAVSGTYTMQIQKTSCSSDPNFIGWAWMQIPYQVFTPMVMTTR